MDETGFWDQERTRFRLSLLEVDQLHGRYSYKLRIPEAESIDSSRLVVLYGDNGTGKTSLLRMLFHLLSTSHRDGHRTALAGIQFARFSVGFSNGMKVSAERTGGELRGGYSLVLVDPAAEAELRVPLAITEDGIIRDFDNVGLIEFYERVALALGVEPFLVGDDRRLVADSLPTRDRRVRERFIEDPDGVIVGVEYDEDSPTAELAFTLERARQWLRSQALRGSNRGTESSNVIYTDLLARLAKPVEDQADAIPLDDSVQRLVEVANKNTACERFGLVPPLDLEPIVEAIRVADAAGRVEAVQSVLQPFLGVLEARLRAVEPLHDALAAYQDALNSFYWDKRVNISLGSGIQVESFDGTGIPPAALSSGERQLLTVLTNVLFARGAGSLFIIDEPEISLNTKWQRRLIDALLDCTRTSGAQFVLATHSFEILSQFTDRVVKLEPSVSGGQLRLEEA